MDYAKEELQYVLLQLSSMVCASDHSFTPTTFTPTSFTLRPLSPTCRLVGVHQPSEGTRVAESAAYAADIVHQPDLARHAARATGGQWVFATVSLRVVKNNWSGFVEVLSSECSMQGSQLGSLQGLKLKGLGFCGLQQFLLNLIKCSLWRDACHCWNHSCRDTSHSR